MPTVTNVGKCDLALAGGAAGTVAFGVVAYPEVRPC